MVIQPTSRMMDQYSDFGCGQEVSMKMFFFFISYSWMDRMFDIGHYIVILYLMRMKPFVSPCFLLVSGDLVCYIVVNEKYYDSQKHA